MSNNKNNKPGLGFIAVVLLVIGSTIGSGIFFKNSTIMTNSGNSLLLTWVSWIIAFVAILTLAFSLVEIASVKNENNNLGPIGWVKNFCNEYLYKAARSFFVFIFLPLNLFIIATYGLYMFFNAIDYAPPFWLYVLLIFVICSYFITTSSFGFKIVNIQNLLITSIKFIPLIFAAIIGFVYLGVGKATIHWGPTYSYKNTNDICTMIPYLAPLFSLPAIFFSYDGFYFACGVNDKMKDKNKLGLALVVGVLSITLIYCIISTSLVFMGGSIIAIIGWLPSWVIKILFVLLTISIFGVLNGLSFFGVNSYSILIEKNELLFSSLFKKVGNKSKSFNLKGFLSVLSYFTFMFIICCCIGMFFTNDYAKDDLLSKQFTGNLFTLVDKLGNWNVVLMFSVLSFSILGGIINRKTKKIATCHSKYFMVNACIALSFMIITILSSVLIVVVNLILQLHDGKDAVIGNCMYLLILFIILLIVFVTPIFEKNKK